MRKIEREIAAAIIMRKPRKIGNTSFDGSTVFLHGNPILHVSNYGAASIDLHTCRKWPTATTRSRVNGICYALGFGFVGLCQRKGVLMVCFANGSMVEAWEVGADYIYAGAIPGYLKERAK